MIGVCQLQPTPMEPLLPGLASSFDTDRLIARCPQPGDGQRVYDALAESLGELRAFPASLPWALLAPSPEQSERFCREACANFVARRDFVFLIFRRDSGALAGCCGLHHANWSVPAFDAGWWGCSSQHGRGLMTEAIRGLLEFAFAGLGARRVAAYVDALNARSIALCERVGMTLEGTLRHERADPDGALRNTCLYASVA